MADATDRFGLPLLQSGQSQKEITHNEALIRVDALLHLSVQSRAATEPPAAPQPGHCWIVAGPATGVWTGKEGAIAQFHTGGWNFVEAADGCLAWVADEGVFAYRTSAVWRSDAWPVKHLRLDGCSLLTATQAAISDPSGGATVDTEARVALRQVLNVLRQHNLIAN